MFIPAFITATITAFLCGILMKFGYVGFLVVFSAIVIGDLLSNIFWYLAGRIGGQTFVILFGNFFGITQDRINSSLNIFDRYKDYAAFFVSAPIGMAIMLISFMTSGIRRLSFWRYIISNTLLSAIWIWLMLALGYLFGHAYIVFTSIIERTIVSMILLAVLFILITLGGWIRMLIMPKL